MSEQDPRFESAFMDDYFAEADEHLVSVRRGLLRLETNLDRNIPPVVLDELFRSFHSLKGISAMVELRDAEVLAHHMESCLRGLRRRPTGLTAVEFDTLLTGANILEAVIGARRANSPAPPITPIVESLETLAATLDPQVGDADSPSPAAATPAGSLVWKVTFVPSPHLIERGIKVDSIRTRLLQIGQVLTVAPKVGAGGGIAFDFEVQTDDEPSLAALKDDGVQYELIRDAVAVAADAAARDAAAAPRPWELAAAGPTNFVRVDLARLDELMRLVGDLVVTRARLEATVQRLEGHLPAQEARVLQEHDTLMERQLRDLREAIMRVRLVPVGEIFRRMPFVVRDLARDSGKRVALDIVGQSTEIDKFLIERMMDPVLHLVRNAISHGIESPDARIAAGKPPEGTIRLSAATAGESVVIQISDDGAGIDRELVADRARQQGLAAEGPLDTRQLLEIITASGFSTREEADRASGRGIGMSVVRGAIQELGGSLAVESEEGRGTTFTITLPLTLAITDAIIAHVGAQSFAVPQGAVREVIEVQAADVRAIEQNELITYRGGTLPIVRLARLFGIAAADRPRWHAIVIGAGHEAVGIVVDRIAGHREIVVKSITDPLIRVDGVSGATELGDGRLVLILDVAALGRAMRGRSRAGKVSA